MLSFESPNSKLNIQNSAESAMKQATPFDSMAADYDQAFTDTLIGARMRQAVWRRLDAAFCPGAHVLELNCGTGEDAVYLARRGVHVLATDISSAMLAAARAKVERAGLHELVQVEQLDITRLAEHAAGPRHFDGALSNFGGLNCVADLAAAARGLAAHLRPGAPALLCVMGPLVPWEWAWYLWRRQPRKAFRRLRPRPEHPLPDGWCAAAGVCAGISAAAGECGRRAAAALVCRGLGAAPPARAGPACCLRAADRGAAAAPLAGRSLSG
jgi:SAM-dependent methyltransferase